MRVTLLIILMSFGSFLFAQSNTIKGKKVNLKADAPILEDHFKKYHIYEIEALEIFNSLQAPPEEKQLRLRMGKNFDWQLSLFSNDMRSEDYRVQTGTGELLPRGLNKSFQGYEQNLGGRVALTVDDNFLYGYVESGGERFFIEPLRYFQKNAPQNHFIVYDEHDVNPRNDVTCAADEMKKHSHHQHEHEDAPYFGPTGAQKSVTGLCYEVEIAIASDYSMFQKYGNITAVENHTTGVMNNVQTNYDDEFPDEIDFVIVRQFVSNCSTCDPWSTTTAAGALLGSFRNWGNSNGFGVPYDVAQLWTDRDLDGSTVGIAYLSGVCNSNRYHVCQDFSSTAWQLRVLTSHELGHNFSAVHDGAGSGFIMAPSVNNSNTWSSLSVTDIDNFVSGLNCLSQCQSLAPPTPLFAANLNNICEGNDVQFFDQSQGVVASRFWSFTGGVPATSTDPNPVVNYPIAGSWPVALTVTNAAGSNTQTLSSYITVGPGGSNVILYDAFENGLGNWIIENPNGNITWNTIAVGGAQIGNTAVYMDNWNLNNSGERDGLISGILDFSGYTNINLSLDYAYTQWSGNTNLADSLVIKISTDGGATFPNVIFAEAENGSGNFSTKPAQNSEFTPSALSDWCYAGSFGANCIQEDLSAFIGQTNLVLKIEGVNDYGNNLYLDNVLISSDCQVVLPPVSDFAATPTQGCTPMTVNFTDLSQNGPSFWSWSFPGGIPNSSSQQNPSVLYTSPGTYDVTLVTTNSAGTSTEVKTGYITVEEPPVANFNPIINGLQVVFNNLSTGGGTYAWDFGDGITSNDPNPVHNYSSDGIYTVTLVAINNCGVNTTSQTITIITTPTASFTASPTSGCAPLTVNFSNNSSPSVTTWDWSFPGGNPATSSDPDPTVTYDNPGIYSVTLTVSNSSGSDTFTETDFITVNALPSANFTQAVNGLTATFTNSSTNANNYSWDFGDGNTSTQSNPSHTYAGDGTYDVVLTATNDCGSVTATQTIEIITQPTAGFSSNVTSGCAPLTVNFFDQSSVNATSWNWDFPGGNPSSSTDQNPTVTYNNVGTYAVTLIVSNAAGNDVMTISNYIVVDDVPTVGFSQNVNGQTVNFTNSSTNANSYIWDFGDGNTSNQSDPTHTYATDGTYIVTLTASNPCGSVVATESITISTQPSAGFGANVTTGCAPFTVQFSDQSSANTTSWNWSFPGGNPTTSTDQNPTVTYNNEGSYTVTLVASNGSGSSTSSITDFILVDDVPSAGFSQNTNGLTVSFTNASTNANSYNWDFGDGNTSNQSNPTHTYTNDGTYDVILTATNNCGSVTTTQTIIIATVPTAGFSANTTSGCVDLVVQFSDQSSNNTTAWNWSFPGGNPAVSTEQNPTVTYGAAGVYSVTLEVSNATGTNTIAQTNYVVVDDVPSVSFSQNTNGLTVDFTNNSTNANSYNWDFGDGNTSTQINPSHTYTQDGVYDVILTATNNCGTVISQETITIVTPPSAGFGANLTSGCADLTVQFSDQSSANATAWNWSFPGGNPTTSTSPNPSVTYTAAGTYSVTLTVTNAAGNSTVEQLNYVVVDDVPNIDFSSDVNVYTVNFNNNSTNANSYSWDFGDGNTSTEENPTHTYANDGTYDVTLTATNNCGTVMLTQTVTVANLPNAGLNSSPSSGCAPFDIQFFDQSSNNTSAWNWSFPGGTPATSTDQNPIIIYSTAGNYDVTLIAINNQGNDTITFSEYVNINATPDADFSFSINGPLVDFTNLSSDATSYFWDFGDGSTSTEADPQHQYNLNGDYNVTLNANNACGTTTITKVVSITSSVIAGFSSNVTSGCMPLTVNFSNESVNATSFNWTFVGGTPASSTSENPTITYENAGVYTVMMEAINVTGSSMVVETGYIVVESLPVANFDVDINGLAVDFTNLSLFGESVLWDFGDGNGSTELNPQHTYADIGIYPVTVTVDNNCGTSTFTFEVNVGTTVSVGFSSENTEACAPTQIQFLDESSDNVSNWNWSFPGGNPATSTEQNPVVSYDTPGTYAVTLEASNTWNSNTLTQTNYITILGEPTAGFSFSTNGFSVDFTNNSDNATSYNWDFGDGNTSTEIQPQHTFANDGTYTVTLNATNTCGTVTTQETITILTPVTAGFLADVTEGCAGLTVQFTNASSNNVTNWNWSFSGGSPATSTEQNPTVTYNTPGTYPVTLEVSNPNFSATQTEMNYVVINDIPTVDFNYTLGANGLVNFNNTSTNATTYSWDFGDNTSSASENPTHTYTQDGTYTVTLTATKRLWNEHFRIYGNGTVATSCKFQY
ncbi:MAG: PKD domain-containing protein [Bacteroidota bacterium]